MTTQSHIADRIGALEIQLLALQAERKSLKDALIATGESLFAGEFYRVTLSTADRHILDMKAVRAKLSKQFITAHTNVTSVTSMKVTAMEPAANVVQIDQAAAA